MIRLYEVKGRLLIMGIFKKSFRWAIIYSLVLVLSTTYVLLDTFVIPRVGTSVASESSVVVSDTAVNTDTTQDADEDVAVVTDTTQDADEDVAVVTDTSYTDENIQITLETEYVDDTEVYIADIQVSDVSYLKTAFANDTYGRNINDTTSSMAESNDAIFAINGDYYGFRNDGYVIRNGVLYRDVSGDNEDLVIDSDGNFSIIEESDTTAQSLIDAGACRYCRLALL